jgi:prepilin-type N-terminal cleavage/methylation domain-containing protein/prepilin-type processing-associated H-X9-DG protein
MKNRRHLSHLHHAERAFTLVELLTVIAIVAVLAGILVVVVGKARGAARSGVCTSNLRQIYVAARLYAADNKDSTPWDNFLVPLTGVSNTAGITLAKYLETPRSWTDYAPSVYTCPEMQSRFPSNIQSSCTYSANGYVGTHREDGTPRAAGGEPRYTLKFSESQFPHKQVFFFDGVPNSLQSNGKWSYIIRAFGGNVQNFVTQQKHFGHDGLANVIFMDGHIAKLPPEPFTQNADHRERGHFWLGYY